MSQFADLSKEEKEELAKQRMEDMRLKNEEIRRRHAEIEADKKNADLFSSSAIKEGAVKKSPPDASEPGERRPNPQRSNPRGPPRSQGQHRPRDEGNRGGARQRPRFEEHPQQDAEFPTPPRDGGEKRPQRLSAEDLPPPDPNFRFLADRMREGGGGGGGGPPRAPLGAPQQDERGGQGAPRGGSRRHRHNYGGQDFENVKPTMRHDRDMEREFPESPPRNPCMRMTGRQRREYDQWKMDREQIDQERLQRHVNAAGEFRREWDHHKDVQELTDKVHEIQVQGDQANDGGQAFQGSRDGDKTVLRGPSSPPPPPRPRPQNDQGQTFNSRVYSRGGPRGRGDGGNRGRGPRRGSGGGGYHEGNRNRTESSGSAPSDRDGGGGGDEDQRDQPRDYQDHWQHRDPRDHRQDHRGGDRFGGGGGRHGQDGYAPYHRGEHRGEDSYRRPQRRGGGRGGMPNRRGGSFDGDMRGGRGGRGGHRGMDRVRGGPPRRGRGGERRGRDFPRDGDRREDRWERRDKADAQQNACVETWETAEAGGVDKGGQDWGVAEPAGPTQEGTGWETAEGATDQEVDVDSGREEVVEDSVAAESGHDVGDDPDGLAPRDVEEESEDHLDPCNDTSSCPESSYLSGHSDLEEHDDVDRGAEESLESTYRESMKLLETMHDPVADADHGDSGLKEDVAVLSDGDVDHYAGSLDPDSAFAPCESEVNSNAARGHASDSGSAAASQEKDVDDSHWVTPGDSEKDGDAAIQETANIIVRLDADGQTKRSDTIADSSCVDDFTDSADVFLSQDSEISDLNENETASSDIAAKRLALETAPSGAGDASPKMQSEDAGPSLSNEAEEERRGESPHLKKCAENGVVSNSALENGEKLELPHVQTDGDVGLTELPEANQCADCTVEAGDVLATVKGKDAGVKATSKGATDDSIGTTDSPEPQKQ
ncbi:hypothetical protein HPB47_008624 [Ixodes persulcatus]|uniref:Uncharacterized protein n=1 Tax=Ixodes persulcatus TaxID=34615 RepID=A0AC60P4I0_IXOPE|nr:hypothetical protein HPB47_008624 [Ixodes persulcatus]